MACHRLDYMSSVITVLGSIRRAANPQKVPYLRSLIHPRPPTHLVCNAHLIANFLSFHMSLVVVIDCGAGNAQHSIEVSMFYFC